MGILSAIIGKENLDWFKKKYLEFILPIIYTALGIFIFHSGWESFESTGKASSFQILILILLMIGIWSSIKKDCLILKYITGKPGYINLLTFIKTHGIVVIDEENRIIYLNKPMCKALGKEKSIFLGKQIKDISTHK